jgi:hypothetical protein
MPIDKTSRRPAPATPSSTDDATPPTPVLATTAPARPVARPGGPADAPDGAPSRRPTSPTPDDLAPRGRTGTPPPFGPREPTALERWEAMMDAQGTAAAPSREANRGAGSASQAPPAERPTEPRRAPRDPGLADLPDEALRGILLSLPAGSSDRANLGFALPRDEEAQSHRLATDLDQSIPTRLAFRATSLAEIEAVCAAAHSAPVPHRREQLAAVWHRLRHVSDEEFLSACQAVLSAIHQVSPRERNEVLLHAPEEPLPRRNHRNVTTQPVSETPDAAWPPGHGAHTLTEMASVIDISAFKLSDRWPKTFSSDEDNLLLLGMMQVRAQFNGDALAVRTLYGICQDLTAGRLVNMASVLASYTQLIPQDLMERRTGTLVRGAMLRIEADTMRARMLQRSCDMAVAAVRAGGSVKEVAASFGVSEECGMMARLERESTRRITLTPEARELLQLKALGLESEHHARKESYELERADLRQRLLGEPSTVREVAAEFELTHPDTLERMEWMVAEHFLHTDALHLPLEEFIAQRGIASAELIERLRVFRDAMQD